MNNDPKKIKKIIYKEKFEIQASQYINKFGMKTAVNQSSNNGEHINTSDRRFSIICFFLIDTAHK